MLTIAQAADHCQAIVYVRDTYRRTGRGKTGFELRYTERQCKRKAKINGLCVQHAKMKGEPCS
jgi:hypothetical protein